MAGIRQVNWLGQMRVESSHLRAVESSVNADFDMLAYLFQGNELGYVVNGLNLTGTVSQPATTATVSIAGASVVNNQADESGSIFVLDDTGAAPAEALTAANTKVVGGFTPSVDNYISLAFVRLADDNDIRVTRFKDAETGQEFESSVPFSRVLEYRIHIDTNPFVNTPNRVAIGVINTDASNNIVSVTDSRRLLFKNDALVPVKITGETGLSTFKEWMDAVTGKIWALSGGPNWFSDTTGKNIRLIRDVTVSPYSNGDYFDWDGTYLNWKSLSILFEGSGINGVFHNVVEDSSTAFPPNGAAMADGDALVLALNYTSAGATITPVVVQLDTGFAALTDQDKIVIAWCRNDGNSDPQVYVRDGVTPVGTQLGIASVSSYGTVRLMTAMPLALPGGVVQVVVGDNKNTNNTYQSALAAGLSRGSTAQGVGPGILKVGHGANDSSVEIGKAGAASKVKGTLDVEQDFSVATNKFNVNATTGLASAAGGFDASLSRIVNVADPTASRDAIPRGFIRPVAPTIIESGTYPGVAGQWIYNVFGNELFLSLDFVSGTRSIISANGKNWLEVGTLPNQAGPVTYGNGKFVYVGATTANTGGYSTDNGTTWSAANVLPLTDSWGAITYGNGLYVAVPSSAGAGKRAIFSSDGITWSQSATTLPSNTYDNLVFVNGKFVAISRVLGAVCSSVDGSNWSATANNFPDTTCYRAIAAKGVILASGGQIGTTFAYSTDSGETWTTIPITVSSAGSASDVGYINGLYLASGSSLMYYSEDLVNWNESPVTFNSSGGGCIAGRGTLLIPVSSSTTTSSFSRSWLEFTPP